MRHWLFAGMVLAALIGCDRETPTADAANPQDEQSPADVAAERYDALRNEIGVVCNVDNDCTSPLRCFDEACSEPPGVVGGGGADTPLVVFYALEGEAAYYMELAITRDQQTRGLMHRHVLQEDWGMIFLYTEETPRRFWMQNTYIPLDIVFVDADLRVVGVSENAVPLTTTGRAVEGDSQYVIELNAGEAERRGIGPNTPVEFINIPDVAELP